MLGGEMSQEEIDWNRDPAASGWRSRAFVGDGFWSDGWSDGKRFELIVYDNGDWEVRGPPIGHAVAVGKEDTAEKGRARCILVWQSLIKEVER